MILTFRRAGDLLHASCDSAIDAAVLATAASSKLVEARMAGRELVRFRAAIVSFKESAASMLEIGDEVLP